VLESVSRRRKAAVAAVAWCRLVAAMAFRGGTSSSFWNVDILARSLVVVMGQIVIFQSLASILTTNDFHVLDQVGWDLDGVSRFWLFRCGS
jgi:hypothetical protein